MMEKNESQKKKEQEIAEKKALEARKATKNEGEEVKVGDDDDGFETIEDKSRANKPNKQQ